MTTHEEAYAALDDAIKKLAEQSELNGIPTDAVLIIGAQNIDDDGDRDGNILVCPRHGCQPSYITTGLMQHALNLMGR